MKQKKSPNRKELSWGGDDGYCWQSN